MRRGRNDDSAMSAARPLLAQLPTFEGTSLFDVKGQEQSLSVVAAND
jgi:hypothetical protein